MSRHPEIKWAQREDKLYITVLLPDSKNPKVKLEPDGVFTFSATAGASNQFYELKLDLLDKVNVEGSKINTGERNIVCVVEKAEKKWWKKLVRDEKTPHYIKADWDKWVDEDEDTGADPDFGLDGMDLSKFGGGGGGMGGDYSMGDDDLGVSDDEDQEVESKEGGDAEKEEDAKLEAAATASTEATATNT